MRNAEVTAMPTITTPRRIRRRSWFTLAQWTQCQSKPIEAGTVRQTGEGTRGDGGEWSIGVLEYWVDAGEVPSPHSSTTPILHYSNTPSPYFSSAPDRTPSSGVSRRGQRFPILRSHAFLERPGGQGKTEVVAHIGDAIGAGGVEIAVGALGFDDERCGLCAHDFAVTLRIADVDEHFGVAWQVQVAAGQIGELHRTVRPVGRHIAQWNARSNHEILHVAGVNAVGHLAEARLPILAFPAVRRIRVHSHHLVAVANLDQQVEIIGAHRRRAGMDFVAQVEAQLAGVRAQLRGL